MDPAPHINTFLESTQVSYSPPQQPPGAENAASEVLPAPAGFRQWRIMFCPKGRSPTAPGAVEVHNFDV